MDWPLFLNLHEDDKYCIDGLRIPLNNSIPEVDMLVLSLVKVLLDTINEKIVKNLTGEYEKITGSISKLELWFKEKRLQGFENHITFLRNLQELRSSGTGHRKGKSYQKIIKKMNIDKNDYRGALIDIFEQSIDFLNYMECNIDNLMIESAI